MGVGVPVTVMQSNGGLIPLEIATEKPMYCIESGPAAGVVGAFHLGRRLDERDLMTFDMGGTTAKASIIEGGEMLLAPEYEVGGGMNAGPPPAARLRVHTAGARNRHRRGQRRRRKRSLGGPRGRPPGGAP